MRKVLLPLVAVAGFLTVGCRGLFAPSVCTPNITVTDTVTMTGHPTTVDTLGTFKFCAQ
ncbi:MAG TPA: hypothetical protein VM716_05625 [Gemmatimonadales bacterium]|nr:hypothetical protein [Gemmatimonadales bacterium]